MHIKKYWYMVVVICLIIVMAVNLMMTIKISQDIKAIRAIPVKARSLACEAIPIRFAMNHPNCANELLYYMNVTNVQFLPRSSLANRSLLGRK